MLPIYSYTRVSTGRQASEGESLEQQQSKTAAYAIAMMDGTITQSFVDAGVSAAVPFTQRPQGSALWSALSPGDAIVCSKLDRMFRSSLDALDTLSKLQAMQVKLFLIDMGGDVTGNGIAKLVFTILSAVAEAEKDRIRERICDVKTYQRQQGRYLGGSVPFGWTVQDGQLIEDFSQQQAITDMRGLRADGLSYRAISASMADRGVTISFKAVSDVLSRI